MVTRTNSDKYISSLGNALNENISGLRTRLTKKYQNFETVIMKGKNRKA